jgi:hypothetical protein
VDTSIRTGALGDIRKIPRKLEWKTPMCNDFGQNVAGKSKRIARARTAAKQFSLSRELPTQVSVPWW